MRRMSATPFDSPEHFRAAFTEGLVRLLDAEGLGAFILVCANAGFDPAVKTATGPLLARRFEEHAGRLRETLRAGRQPQGAEDDLGVFLRLVATGFDGLADTETRAAGPFEVQFNHLRAFRPPRNTSRAVETIRAAFDPAAFNFNRPFLAREVFWEGRLGGSAARLLYNKFPFAELHGLLVPEPEAGHAQFLGEDHHHWVWSLCRELGPRLPGFGVGYNALGAYASVNHLHFQTFLRPTPLPLAAAQWRHNGGDLPYPAECVRLDQAEAAWRYLDGLHRSDTAYNLLYLPDRLYCLPRRKQGSYAHAGWTGGYAWYEMCGGAVTFNREDYLGLDAQALGAELAKTAPVA